MCFWRARVTFTAWGAPWEEILPVLRQRGIVPTASVRQMLLETEDLVGVLNCAESVGFDRGFLTVEILEDMLAVWRGMQRAATPSPTDTTKESTNDAPAKHNRSHRFGPNNRSNQDSRTT
jgi:hypothetical protein